MKDLSLKGVAQRFAGVSGDFDVLHAVFGIASASGTLSLRAELEMLARKTFAFKKSECIYEWTARYQQTWSHVLVRIHLLSFLDPVPQSVIDALMPVWKPAIEDAWNNKWAAARAQELPCRLSFEVQWVGGNAHQNVFVRAGPGQTNVGTWHQSDGGAIVAHEFGHMLGNPDEYDDEDCPLRNPVNTATIMDNNDTAQIPARLLQAVANNIGAIVAPP